MASFRGTDQADNFVGGDDDDQFEELGAGNDSIDGGGSWDFVSYRWDGGVLGIKATLGANGNGEVVDTFGDTDTIVSVQGFEGSRWADQISILVGGDYNIQPGRGADTITIAQGARVTLDYAYLLDREVVDFIKELNLDLTGITLDFAASSITSYNGEVDTFTKIDRLEFRGSAINDVLRAADDGLRTVIDGRGGSDVMIAGDRHDMANFDRESEDINAGFTINLAEGRATNSVNSDIDSLINFQRVRTSNFDDTIVGDGRANVFEVMRGHDQIDGGGGIDTIELWIERGDFTITGIGSDVVTVTSGSDWGVKTLTNVERIDFQNGLLAIDIEGNAGQSYRLYQAAFDRRPDTGGLRYWMEEMDEGKTDLVTMAKSFILSEEFRGLYGDPATLSNQQFLDLLYANVLDRAPDQEGSSYWIGKLEAGEDRAVMLASFAESTENKANVLPAISDGIWFEYN
jgi:hypothetical protein